MKRYFKYFLEKKIPNFIEYLLIFKLFYKQFLLLVHKSLNHIKYLSILNKNSHLNVVNTTYLNVIKSTFQDCYMIFKPLNIVYFGEINIACHRFLILNNDPLLAEKLRDALALGFVISIERKGISKILSNKNISLRYLNKQIKNFTLLRIYKVYKNRHKIEEFGESIAFEIEGWYEINNNLETKSINNIQNKLLRSNLQSTVSILVLDKEVEQITELFEYFKHLNENSVKEVDLVYTWVDGEDEKWLEKKEQYLDSNASLNHSSRLINRYISRDELKYSLRSIEKYFLGYRKIFIVVDNHKPNWLKESKNLILINHTDIFPDKDVLPVFNSHAIETVLHKIKGLSEHYIYMNDDVFLARPIDVSVFFPKKGTIAIFPSTETYIPFSQSSKELLPVDSASINTRELLKEQNIGVSVNKFKHTPLAQLKSLLVELEERFSVEVSETRKSRFRHPKDLSMTSSLLFNFSYFRGIAFIKKIKYTYINIGVSNYLFRLKKVTHLSTRERPDIFCVNDVCFELDNNKVKKDFINSMEIFLPEKSIYEI